MHAPVAERAIGVVEKMTPTARMQPTVEGPLGRRTAPEIPVHTHGHRTVRRGLLLAASAGHEQSHLTDLAHFAATQKFHGLHMMRPNAPV